MDEQMLKHIIDMNNDLYKAGYDAGYARGIAEGKIDGLAEAKRSMDKLFFGGTNEEHEVITSN